MNKPKPNKSYRKGLPRRKSIRLKGYDYSKAGLYFITICCQDKIYRFGDVENGVMILNEFGTVAHNEWAKLVDRFPNMEMDVFQIMPNHMHSIIALKNSEFNTVGATLAVAPNPQEIEDSQATARAACTVGDIVGAYKSLVFNACLNIYKSRNEIMGKFWQRNYYEIIIRNPRAYRCISDYIINNPAKWSADKLYKK